MKRGGFDFQAARRSELERTVRIFDIIDTDDFHRFLIAWHWHNAGNTKDPVGSLMLAVDRMGGNITEEQAEHIIQEAATTRQRRSADALARYLGITDEMRRIAGLKTIGSIDVNKRQRARRRKEQKRMRIENNRRAQGAKPRAEYEANSLTRAKPWEKELPPSVGGLGTTTRKRPPPRLHKSVPNPLLPPRMHRLHKSVPNLLSQDCTRTCAIREKARGCPSRSWPAPTRLEPNQWCLLKAR